MRKLLALALMLVVCPALAQTPNTIATVITNAPPASLPLVGNELIPIVQGGLLHSVAPGPITGPFLPLAGGTLTGDVSSTATTASTSPITGAIHTNGGLGVLGQVNVGATAADFTNTGFFGATFGTGILAGTGMNVINSTKVENFLVSTQTTHPSGFGFPTEALSASCVANWPTDPESCWAIYAESVRPNAGNATSVVLTSEFDANNLKSGTGTALNPSSSSTVSGNHVNLWLASGGSATGTKYDISAYLGFVNNGAAAKSGIVSTCAALVRTGGTACSDNPGSAEFAALYEGDEIAWYSFGGSTPKARLTSTIAAAGAPTNFNFNGGYMTITANSVMTNSISLGVDRAPTNKGLLSFSGAQSIATDAGVWGGGTSSGADIGVQTASGGTGHLRALTTDVLTWVAAGVTLNVIPASAGAGGIYVCVDTAGVLYKKSACP